MKKKLSTLVLILLAATGLAHAYNFSKVTSSGHTLYYNIVSNTSPLGAVETFSQSDDRPVGNLVIDSLVTYGGKTYQVVRICDNAFSNAYSMTSVSIPNSVISIGQSAFSGCNMLTSVHIPNSVTSIGNDAFFLVRMIYFNGSAVGGPWGALCMNGYIEDSLYYASNTKETLCSAHPSITLVNIPNSVSVIGNHSFDGCSNISTVFIGNNVQYIPNNLFCDCSGLTTVTIGNSVTSIGSNAFYGCTSLLSITIPDATTEICSSAFSGCTSLTSAIIGNAVTSIGSNAFYGCLRLTSVSLGEGVVNIGYQAFKNCGIIGELVIPQSVTTIGYEGFCYCYGINEITCLGRVAPSLDSYVFEGLDTSITVNIPCGTTNLYAGRWSYFHNFNEIPFLFNVASADLAQGTVQMVQEPSCDDPVAIVQATARNGYHFDHWSDGSTQNPYTCVVTGSMTMTAFFAPDGGPEGIEEADGDVRSPRVYAAEGRIIVEGYEGETVQVYDLMGRKVSTGNPRQVYPDGIYLVRIGDSLTQRVVVL